MGDGDGFQVLNLNEMETMEGSGECEWRLVRKSLGVSSFGMNAVDIGPGGQIPEHDESERDQEEVFIVLDGEAVAEVDGTTHPAPAGTFVRVAPEVRRQIRNEGEGTVRVLIISAPRSSGYEPMGWG